MERAWRLPIRVKWVRQIDDNVTDTDTVRDSDTDSDKV